MPTIETEAKPNKLARLIESSALGPVTAKQVMDRLGPLMLRREELFLQADQILLMDPALPSTRDKAEACRKGIKKEVRLLGEKARVEMKDDFLRGGQAIDNLGHAVTDPCEEMEAKLEAVEKHDRIMEAKRKEELKASRTAILAPFGFEMEFYDLAEMSEPQFVQLHQSFIALKKSNEEAAAKAESDRVAAETARLAEEAKVREENLRLQREAEAREAAHKAELAKAEAERKAADEKARAELEAIEASAKKEREALELRSAQERLAAANAARIANEASRAERAKIEAAAAEQRRLDAIEHAKVQKALDEANAARKAAEKKAAQEKAAEEKRIADEAKAKKKAEAAPDKIKLHAFAEMLRGIAPPAVKSLEYVTLLEGVSLELMELAQRVDEAAKID